MPIPTTALAVDVSETVCDMVAMSLQQLGLSTLRCRTGAEALATARAHALAGAVIDIALIDQPGLEIVKKWRSIGRDFPVIITGIGITAEHVLLARSLDINAIISKPIDVSILEQAIFEHFPNLSKRADSGEWRQTTRNMLRSMIAEQRLEALDTIQSSPDPEFHEAVIAALDDPVLRVRFKAAQTLILFGDDAKTLAGVSTLLRDSTAESERRIIDLALTVCPAGLLRGLEEALESTDLLTRSTGRAMIERIRRCDLEPLLQQVWLTVAWNPFDERNA